MPWNPFQFQFTATYLADEGEEALVELKRGALSETIKIPQALLPSELEPGSVFSIKIQDAATAQTHEKEALRALLESLIK